MTIAALSAPVEHAAKLAPYLKGRIVAATDSQDPWQFAAVDSWRAARTDAMPDRLARLVSDLPHVRAGEVREALWWGCSRPELFKRLFGLDHWALWCDWGCALATC